MYTYKTSGTCSSAIELEIDENNIVTMLHIVGGCRGNTEGVNRLCVGRDANEVADMLAGIPCRGGTSCPDQVSRAIRAYLAVKA